MNSLSTWSRTWGHMTNWKLNISSSARLITTKHGRLVTYAKRNPPNPQSFFRAPAMVFCLWENARIIVGYWLPKNYVNFSWVGGNFCVFRFSRLAISLSKFLFSVVKKVANIPLLLVFQVTMHHLYYNLCFFRHLIDWNLLQYKRSQPFLDHAWKIP